MRRERQLRAAGVLLLLLFACASILVVGFTMTAEAQTADIGNKSINIDLDSDGSDESLNESSMIYQLQGGIILQDVTYKDGSTFVTLAAPESADGTRAAVSEAVSEQGSFERVSADIPRGGTRTVELPVKESDITVVTESEGFLYESAGGIDVVLGDPDTSLLQIAAVSGSLGAIFALTISAGRLRRKNENTYEELFSDERKEIQQGTYEGWREKVVQWFENRYESTASTALGIALLAYTALAALGVIATPGQIWFDVMGDAERIISAWTVAATIFTFPVIHWFVERLYNPEREFVLDLDSKGVYMAEQGDKSASIAAYAAKPDRIAECDVDGAVTTLNTPGGRCHLMRDFDPEENTAEANPPEIADDRETSIHVQKIEHNRQILTDLATIGRDLIGAMSAFRVTADSAAMQDIDAGLRDSVSAGSDSLEGVLQEAVAGTRYEGTYQPDAESVIDESEAGNVGNDEENPGVDAGETDGNGGEEQ